MTLPYRVLCTDGLAARGREVLHEAKGLDVDVREAVKPEELTSLLQGVHALIVRSATKVTADFLAKAPDLRVIGRAGIGVDNIDVQAASRRGVVVMNTPHGNAVTTAEHAIALLLALARHIPQATASVKAGRWERKRFEGTEVCEKTLGVCGLGNIGRLVAERALGLKMKVVTFDPFITADAAARLGVERVTLDELLARSDFITVHTPLTTETRGLLSRQAFAKCRKGVLVINAARGGVVDEDALFEALQSGQVAGAALDVFVAEPPKDNRLLALDHVICTPHLGASTEEAQERVAVEVAEQVVAFLLKGEIRHAVNLPPLAPELHARLGPWLELATRLGSLGAQLTADAVDEVTIEASGEASEGTKAIAACVLQGMLRLHLDFPVNWVNAPIVAAERGIKVSEVTRRQGDDWKNAILLRLRGGGVEHVVAGSLLHLGGAPEARILRIDDFFLEAVPEGALLVVQNDDRPGVIGAVGTLLGQTGINVSRMQVGLHKERRRAMQLWNVDSEVSVTLLEALRKVPGVRHVTQVRL